jgi:hypothetical protein
VCGEKCKVKILKVSPAVIPILPSRLVGRAHTQMMNDVTIPSGSEVVRSLAHHLKGEAHPDNTSRSLVLPHHKTNGFCSSGK